MHDTLIKTKERPLDTWSLDELFDEHGRLRKRFEDETNDNSDIGDPIWMIHIGIELRDRGIEIANDYALI